MATKQNASKTKSNAVKSNANQTPVEETKVIPAVEETKVENQAPAKTKASKQRPADVVIDGNIIINTGTASISIAEKAVAAVLGEKVLLVTAPVAGTERTRAAFAVKNEAGRDEFYTLFDELKAKWDARYKTLKGLTTNEKRNDYKVLVVGWAQENGAETFTLAESKPAKPAKANKTGKQPIIKKKEKAPAPAQADTNFDNEFDGFEKEAEVPAETIPAEEVESPFNEETTPAEEVETKAQTVAPGDLDEFDD